jgi:hypothetical protein
MFSSSRPPCRLRSAVSVGSFGERRRGGAGGPTAATIAGSGWCARRAGGCEPRLSEAVPAWSCVQVQGEFPGMRPQPYLVDLVALVLQVGLQEVGGERVAGEEELMVGLQRVEHAIQ